MPDKSKAYDALKINRRNRLLLSLDGGGIRGIMTLQMLKKLEQLAGLPCYELFDMVAGTSTGGIIAGLIASGKTAAQVETLYVELVREVFTKRGLLANRYANPPEYTKAKYREILKEILLDGTIQDACSKTGTDILITSKDVAAGEETYFTCFEHKGNYTGTYKDILLRAALEATMSAPTYFTPLERFVDGGTTTYGNPVLAAVMEAVRYGPAGKYSTDKLTVFSFGTGCRPQFVPPEKVDNPNGIDALFWLQWLMTESSDDSSDMQTFLLRSRAFSDLDFRRFNISLDKESINKLPNRELGEKAGVEAAWLWDLTDEDVANIPLDKVSLFPLMQIIGEAMVDFIANAQNPPFSNDLVDAKGKELLVSRRGDVDRIRTQLSDPQWLDGFEH